MNEGLIGILVLVGISIAIAAACHSRIGSFIGAIFTAAIASAVLFHFFVFVLAGDRGPFFLISLVTAAFYALVISVPVGVIARYIRPRRTAIPTPRRNRRPYLP